MDHVWTYTLGSVLAVSLISLLGAVTLAINKKTLHQILHVLVSFSAGALLGDAFIHLLPELVEEHGFGLDVSFWILFGLITFFTIEKFVCWHHCHTDEECESSHHHHGKSHTHHHHKKPLVYSVLFGDALHNFIDGLVIGASYLVSIPVGIATTIAVIFHEIPQEIGDFGVLLHGGYSVNRALLLNFLTALTAILGAVIALALGNIDSFLPALIAFTAGTFIYIAAADLIPELHKELRVPFSALQLAGFLLGVLVMYGLLFIDLA